MRTLSEPEEVSVTSGAAPLTVVFHSPVTAGEYYWDFGDETGSNEKDPVHVYESPGTFSVRLDAVTNMGGGRMDIASFTSTITVTQGIPAAVHPVAIAIGLISVGTEAFIMQPLPSGSRILARKRK